MADVVIIKSNSGVPELSEQEQKFIELVAEMPFNKDLTIDDVIAEVGISRRSYFNWKKKFEEEIASYSGQNLFKLEPKLYGTVAEMLDSDRASERKTGAEMFLKLQERYEKRVEAQQKKKEVEEINIHDIFKELGI